MRENGSRNFTDVAIQIQYRTDAEFRRNNKTSNPAPQAKSVDCHRWFANHNTKSGAMALILSREVAQSLLCILDVVQRQLPRFDQPRHDEFWTAAE